MEVGSRLAQLRENRKLSKNKLAKLSGVAQTYVGSIESGEKQPTIQILEKLCAALEISLAQFFSEDNAGESVIPSHIHEMVELASSLTPRQLHLVTELLRELHTLNR